MCRFFSLVSNPKDGDIMYCDWTVRELFLKKDPSISKLDSPDSHSSIATYFGYNGEKEDVLNKYEYNPLTKKFQVDQMNGEDDSASVEAFCKRLDFKKIVPMLIIKSVIHPLSIKPKKIGIEEINLLHAWASVRNSTGNSFWASIWDTVWDTVGDTVGASVRDTIGDSIWDTFWASIEESVKDSLLASVKDSTTASVRDTLGAYISSFFSIEFKYDFSPAVTLWEKGLIPTYNCKVWQLRGGEKAEILWSECEKGYVNSFRKRNEQ